MITSSPSSLDRPILAGAGDFTEREIAVVVPSINAAMVPVCTTRWVATRRGRSRHGSARTWSALDESTSTTSRAIGRG
jgi:hypothetical protein